MALQSTARNPLRVALIAFGLMSAWSGTAAGEDLSTLVDRIIVAYGGGSVLSTAVIERQTGRTVSARRGGATGEFVRTFQGADRLRMEIAYPHEEAEIRVLDGEKGWQMGLEVDGAMHGAMRLQAARLALPRVLLERISELGDGGTATGPNNVEMRVLQLPLDEQTVLLVGVDGRSGRIVATRGIIQIGQHQAMEFGTTYGDFKEWQGRLIAGKEEQYAMGQYTSTTYIDTVEILESVDPTTFQP